MSTKVQKFHLSSECRYILYRLRDVIQSILDKDIVEGFPCAAPSFGSLFPLIYQAFMKIWCGKLPLVVKKPYRSFIGLCDSRKVLVDYEYLDRLERESVVYQRIPKEASEDLSF